MQEDDIRKLVREIVQRVLGEGGGGTQPVQPAGMSGRKLITEADLREAPIGSDVAVPPHALLTPLARDVAQERGLRLVPPKPNEPARALPAALPVPSAGTTEAHKTVALGADHGGFAMKQDLKLYLQELGYSVLDCGTHSPEPVDYPDLAYAVARLVAEGRAAQGIMIDGAGIGSCMTANKVPGVRAAMCYDLSTAINSREHNDANVLTLGGGLLGGALARQIVKTWLTTAFGGGRHARRVDKITAIEKRYLKA